MSTPDGPPSRIATRTPREDGPYVLRPLLDDVPLSADGSQGHVGINCVEYLDGNLYVGTSASELLHFVQIPPDPADGARRPVFILASRLSPAFSGPPGPAESPRPGVQEILLLPRVAKACVLCNWTVTFYSLPELSPVSGPGQVKNCSWIGGTDLNQTAAGGAGETATDVTILLSLKRRIQAVRVGDGARVFKNIDFAGSVLSVRRDSIACVADTKSYALLDIERQLKIPLMSISSLDEPPPPEEVGQAQSIAANAAGGIMRSASSAEKRPQSAAQQIHNRSASLGGSILGNIRRQEPRRPAAEEPTPQQQASPAAPPPGPPSPPAPAEPGSTASSTDKPLPTAPSAVAAPSPMPEQQQVGQQGVRLKPHIASLTADEFLVVIGTSPSEPGIGMFVNLDGDATRATIGFEQYPVQLAVDGAQADLSSSRPGPAEDSDGYVLASMAKGSDNRPQYGLEIQRWGAGSEGSPEKHWLAAEGVDGSDAYGIGPLSGRGEIQFEAVVGKLCHRRFSAFPGPIEASTSSLRSSDSRTASSIERLSKEQALFERDDSQDDDSLPDGWEATRVTEGEEFARRLAKTEVRLAVWAGDRIWWAVRNPLILQLDSALDAACPNGFAHAKGMDKQALFSVAAIIRGREAKTELQFLTFGYLRQKMGLLLLVGLLTPADGEPLSDGELEVLEEVLIDSKLDARVVLSLVPGLRNEIIEGRRGIWVYGGVRQVADAFLRSAVFEGIVKAGLGGLGPRVLHFLRGFLWSWRKMKGFGSVADENEVFRTVDAALLTVLLQLDQHSPRGLGKGGAVRSELNEVVDRGVDCFERAVDLLESHHRLFVLSRLYQSRKMAGDVLATWRRIIEGQRDDGQELRDGEQRVREYLAKVSSRALVQEYGVWLANRNPRLGVEVFAEDGRAAARAPRFEPARVVELLRSEAPGAVKHYLEHLVFGRGDTAHVPELVAHYLDVVLGGLEASAASREAAAAALDAYRALRAPKPTFRRFLADNAPGGDDAWRSRLRLLQLLGGRHDYDAAAVRARVERLAGDLLVPEAILLAGRQRRHEKALRLLVHDLGDYDSAVAYCLRGGNGGGGGLADDEEQPPEEQPPEEQPPELQPEQHQQQQQPETTHQQQRRLFNALLRHLLALPDASARVAQTRALLSRFGRWFDADDVLARVPPGWSVDVVAGFLAGALTRLARDRRAAAAERALRAAENLRACHDVVEGVRARGGGGVVEPAL